MIRKVWQPGAFVLSMAAIASGMHCTVGCLSAPALTAQELEGKHIYAVRCAHCHEDNDLALKKVPPDLHAVFHSTTLPSGAAANDAEVRRIVVSGRGMMPAFSGRFTEEQMDALLAYLRTGLR